jgi:hypothetical protein
MLWPLNEYRKKIVNTINKIECLIIKVLDIVLFNLECINAVFVDFVTLDDLTFIDKKIDKYDITLKNINIGNWKSLNTINTNIGLI